MIAENPATGQAVGIQVKSRRTHVVDFIVQGNPGPFRPVSEERVWAFVTVGKKENPVAPEIFFVGGRDVNRNTEKRHSRRSWWCFPTALARERYANLHAIEATIGTVGSSHRPGLRRRPRVGI